MEKHIYCLLGLPGSGKGTQAQILSDEKNLEMIGIGDLVREVLEGDDGSDPFIVEIKKKYDQGVPQDDEVVFDLISKKLSQLDRGVILDNFPFSKEQSKFLDEYVKNNDWQGPTIIHIKTDPLSSIERISHRKVCPECGKIFKDIKATTCDICQAELAQRIDDNEETIKKRIDFYHPRIKEIINIYTKENKQVIEVDGEKTIEEVAAEIRSVL